MGRSLVDNQRSESVRKRVYLPDVDEFRSSSGPLSEVVLESLDPVSSLKAKPLKEGYVADITRCVHPMTYYVISTPYLECLN
ncbi:hypothetical protein GBAR_LOCUS21635, partial [Geodia barretti]